MRVPFVRRLIAQANDGLPVRASKLKLYDEFVARLKGGPFLGGRAQPSLPDLAAYPQFALYYRTGFRGANDILESKEIMHWLRRMTEFVSGQPSLIPKNVCRQDWPEVLG